MRNSEYNAHQDLRDAVMKKKLNQQREIILDLRAQLNKARNEDLQICWAFLAAGIIIGGVSVWMIV
jgi:ABC-type nickel/cobalt efflux system permease component RcnA